ncbi:C40 family peptidase [Brachybacterium aquaticum]|uniref:Cell wall-associated NlpC family hydrolase n=1 Tax=Brachybacterium aquaticum TaxID=1432564 RepID=A0A841AAR5_9MICO|nr:peptidoglycan-binding protein [Brachybacterium aquaticum]MBB5830392.1 cell wall-associated NlpC family hydrolase [Brachybacterium aquaticum]
MFRTAAHATHRAPGRAVIDYRGLAAPVGKGVGGVAVIGAVSATAALAGTASASAQAPAAPTSSAVRGVVPAPAAPTVLPATTQYTSVKLRPGARGSAVTYLQQQLNASGADLSADGVFGAATLKAVRTQQASAGLAVDGVVGPKTWATLTGTSAAASVATASTSDQPKLRQGARGDSVRTLQNLLNASGASLTVDGVFGAGTASAVRALQSAAGIGVDGVVGPKTWNALGGSVRIPADGTSGASTAPAGGSSASTGTSVDGAAVISAARAQIGVRYTWGGSTPSTGFDCSGLVYHAYNQAGINLPRKTAKGYTFGGRIISQSEAQPGDLVAFTGNDYGHMGIYVGNGRIIDASGSRQQVVERSIWNAPHVFVTYR